MLNRRIFLTSVAGQIALMGCAAQPPAPTTVALTLSGAADMNGASPAQIKVYYLNDVRAFGSSDFFAVFEAPEVTLGSDLISVSSFGISPGRIVAETQSFDSPPAAIGVVAAFRDISGTFLASRPLTPNAPNPITVTLTGNRVVIS